MNENHIYRYLDPNGFNNLKYKGVRKLEIASIPWTCDSCGREGSESWKDISHAWSSTMEMEFNRLYLALQAIVNENYSELEPTSCLAEKIRKIAKDALEE